MIHPSKKSLASAALSPFHRAFNLYPGTLLMDKWKDSRARALEDVAKLEDENLKQQLQSEIYSLNSAGEWVGYIVKKYAAAFETN